MLVGARVAPRSRRPIFLRRPACAGPGPVRSVRCAVGLRAIPRMRGSPPACCTPATGCRWSFTAASRRGGCPVLGDNTLDIDKRFLTLGLRDAAQANGNAQSGCACGPAALCGRGECRHHSFRGSTAVAIGVPDPRIPAGRVEAGGFAGRRTAARMAAGRESSGRVDSRCARGEIRRGDRAAARRTLSVVRTRGPRVAGACGAEAHDLDRVEHDISGRAGLEQAAAHRP